MNHTTAHKQSVWLKLIFSVFILILFIGSTEILLRIIEPDLYQKNQFFPLNRDIDFPDVYEKDTDLFWKFRPNLEINSRAFSDIAYRINNYGMRGTDIDKKKSGYRIICLGNSCTFGWGVTGEAIWTTILENDLKKRLPSKDIEVLNCGVPGYSSHQGKIYFKKRLLDFNPDMVIVMFGWNDQWPAGSGITDAEQDPPNSLIIWGQNILSRLKSYQLLRKWILSSSEEPTKISLDNLTIQPRVNLEHFDKNLIDIIETAKQNGIKPMLIAPPIADIDVYFEGMTSKFHDRHKRYQNQMIQTAKIEDVTVVNPQDKFNRHNNLFDDPADDPIHFNLFGHRVFTDAIVDSVLSVIEK